MLTALPVSVTFRAGMKVSVAMVLEGAGRPEGGRILLGALEGSGSEQIAPRAGLGIPVWVEDAHLALAEEARPLRWSPGRVGVHTSSPASRTSRHLKGAPAPPAHLRVRVPMRSPVDGFLCLRTQRSRQRSEDGLLRPAQAARALVRVWCGVLCLGGERAGRSRRDATPTSESSAWAGTLAGSGMRAMRGRNGPSSLSRWAFGLRAHPRACPRTGRRTPSPGRSPGLCFAPFLLETGWVAAATGAIFIKVDSPGG